MEEGQAQVDLESDLRLSKMEKEIQKSILKPATKGVGIGMILTAGIIMGLQPSEYFTTNYQLIQSRDCRLAEMIVEFTNQGDLQRMLHLGRRSAAEEYLIKVCYGGASLGGVK